MKFSESKQIYLCEWYGYIKSEHLSTYFKFCSKCFINLVLLSLRQWLQLIGAVLQNITHDTKKASQQRCIYIYNRK